MLTRVKSAVANFMGGIMAGSAGADHGSGADLPLRFPYGRPEFLGLSPDEVECSADHIARPILILNKDTRRLPWTTGYAEITLEKCTCVNVLVSSGEENGAVRISFGKRFDTDVENES
ncbi:hypothetical protein BTVI_50171 [Pitangus sulphuratus]|nr:hypothetical protein BTVI_50171 [Pitangus sulphuratus]